MSTWKDRKQTHGVTKQVTLCNPKNGELWLCDDYNTRRRIDGIEFVEVHKPDNPRKVWININTLTVKKSKN